MKNAMFTSFLLFSILTNAQGFEKTPSVGIAAGLLNYQGDLQPNGFSFKQSNPYVSLYFVQPLSTRLSFRSGLGMGKLEAADRNNRGYLIPRNLSFKSNIKEAYAGFQIYLLNREKVRFSPYLFVGTTLFHFNPYAFDEKGEKVYLQPLSTEGQGVADYPNRKVYHLTQKALCLAGGFKYQLSSNVVLGWELSQHKTFTDYLDDVSATYVDRDKLLAAKGLQSVAMAFRGDELPGGGAYPKEGEQRGTPTENDWYYFFGVTMEVKLAAVKEKAAGLFQRNPSRRYDRCPTRF